MVLIDKAAWHIDAGEPKKQVINRFQVLFDFLQSHSMLSAVGEEIYEFGIDSSISLHEKMLTSEGLTLIKKIYDDSLAISNNNLKSFLEESYKRYKT